MSDAILTINAGSSSVKAAIFEIDNGAINASRIMGHVSGVGDRPEIEIGLGAKAPEKQSLSLEEAGDHHAAIAILLGEIERKLKGLKIVGIGHRIVHGGKEFSAPQRLSPAVVAKLAKLTPLAPGHQPQNLKGVAATTERWPNVTQVACFDTAFHRTQPLVAERFALPRALSEEGVIRYGFHGLSYEYIASAAPLVMGKTPHRMIVAHLGAGASMCAMRDGESIATTMGFTALDGLPMATRCGDIDAGVLLYLLQEKGVTADDLADLLYNQSGLLGMSGVSGDMRELQQSANPAAAEAIECFVYRCVREIGSLAAALGGLDALVFTAGIGEHSSTIRKRIVTGAAWLGLELDETANASHTARITTGNSEVNAWVMPTNEEVIIARQTLKLITQ